MKIFKGLNDRFAKDKPILTIGTFDGIHVGHLSLIGRIVDIARKENKKSALLTFDPHPRTVLFPENPLQLLQTMDEKIDKLESTGLDYLIIHPFTKEFSALTAMQFLEDIVVKYIAPSKIIIGYDHQFGRNREGNIDFLKKHQKAFNFSVEEIEATAIKDNNISSTKIRKAITEGDVETARLYLGAPYCLTGTVVKGNQIGRTLGYPTANLSQIAADKLIPGHGVYLVAAFVDNEKCFGLMNIGVRPTLQELGNEMRVEIHFLDFERDLYEKKITVSILRRLRDEKEFHNLTELKQQLSADETKARSYISSISI